MSEFMMT